MKLTVNASKDAVKDFSGGNYLNTEGIFDVTLNFVNVATTTNGAKQVCFNVKYNDNEQVIYGPIIINKDEKQNEIGMQLLNKLGVIIGLGDGDDLTIEEQTHKVGKDQKAQDFEVITDFSGQEVKLRVQREYTKNPNTGEIQRSLQIRNVFRMDGASAAEIAGETEFGKQMAIELAKYSATPSYKDGITPEEAAAWEAKKATAAKSTAASPVSAVTAKKSTLFAKKS